MTPDIGGHPILNLKPMFAVQNGMGWVGPVSPPLLENGLTAFDSFGRLMTQNERPISLRIDHGPIYNPVFTIHQRGRNSTSSTTPHSCFNCTCWPMCYNCTEVVAVLQSTSRPTDTGLVYACR